MTDITQCPQCGTRFKVTQAQRESHQGMVRCGHCQAVFNAAAHLYDETPSPQLALPIEPPETAVAHTPAEPVTPPHAAAETDAAQDFSYLEDVYEAPRPVRPALAWPWLTGAALLFLLLGVQAAYFYRVEIASRFPAVKPAMERVCMALKCSIPLPQQADLLNLESSAMEADPAHPSDITLSALLRNNAPYAQAYPNIELTLTNYDDKALARRTFSPEEYLSTGNNAQAGLPANSETLVKLHLNTNDLKPAGYRLYLLYPQ